MIGFIAVLLFGSTVWGDEEEFRFNGYVAQETAYRLSSPHNFTKIKQIAALDFKTRYNDYAQIKLGFRGFYDAVYDLTDQFPDDVDDNMRKELVLRDGYIDFTLPKANIRLGHQQIVWGEALSQFFADVVNPKDFREFFLPTFNYIRIPIWALDVQYTPVQALTIEGVLTPDRAVNKSPLPGSEFAFFIPPPPPGVEQIIEDDDRPSTNFKVWNGGGRIILFLGGWDLGFVYYTSADHLPALFTTGITTDPNTGELAIEQTPEHKRLQHGGLTFSKNVGDILFRGELVGTFGRFFTTTDPTINRGVTRRNQFRYLLGIDFSIDPFDFIVEVAQDVIFGSHDDLVLEGIRGWLFLRSSASFLDDSVVPELLFIIGTQGAEYQISPRLHYNINDYVQLTWGVDLFGGPADSLYGEYSNKDRLFMNTRFTF